MRAHQNLQTVRSRPRRGVAMITTLVCLLIVTMLVTAMLQSALQSRRQLRVERSARQVLLLLEAGAQRASQQLAADPSYEGETLRLVVPANTEAREGEIVLRATNMEGESRTRVEVVARYPVDTPQFVKRTLSYSIPQPLP